MIPVTELVLSLNFPVQITVTFTVDNTSPLVDILAANLAIRNLPRNIITDFVTQLYYNFSANSPVIISASALSSALLATPRLFKISEVMLLRTIRLDFNKMYEKIVINMRFRYLKVIIF